ncbi:hypothetical protein F8M41_001449 [Gigaspora margarita]|uniref:Uncharacterized protein n=1 Tax=Gigaspora margarita TaxID=4874 RepID=A0A8H4AZ93_GIGMA|nr:hypothetical protein F8M41_001449 [Gigaspora margarita]
MNFIPYISVHFLETKVEEWIIFQNDHWATLHKLDLYFSEYGINPEIFYSLGENKLFFSKLQDLSFYLGPISELNTENAIALLKILAKNATELSALKLDGFYSGYEPQLLHALICIIKSQEQLRQFSLVGGGIPKEFYGIISALENQKILRIKDCNNVNILETSLNTLEITNHMLYSSTIVKILEKSGTLLQRLKLVSTYNKLQEEPLLLETLKSFCPNITYLCISDVDFSHDT